MCPEQDKIIGQLFLADIEKYNNMINNHSLYPYMLCCIYRMVGTLYTLDRQTHKDSEYQDVRQMFRDADRCIQVISGDKS